MLLGDVEQLEFLFLAFQSEVAVHSIDEKSSMCDGATTFFSPVTIYFNQLYGVSKTIEIHYSYKESELFSFLQISYKVLIYV